MSTTTQAPAKAVDPVPNGLHTVTPHLICDGAADAIEFYKNAFGATEMMRVPAPNGRLMHATVKIGDSIVMLVDENPEWNCLGPNALKGTPVVLHLQVPDVDAWFERAVNAGAKTKMPLADMFWGDRYGIVTDPFGHHWSMATHVRDVSPEELAEAAKHGCGG